MVLARNTYRFGLLVVAFSIAEGIRTMGSYGADLAGIGFVVGVVGLFGGTLAHLARGPDGGADAGTGEDGSGDAGGSEGGNEQSDGDPERPASASAGRWY
jgi:hypothetical protein